MGVRMLPKYAYMIELSKKMSRTPMGKHIKYIYPIDMLKEELNKLQ